MKKRKKFFLFGMIMAAFLVLSLLSVVPIKAATGVAISSGVATQGIDGTVAAKASAALNGSPSLIIEANMPGLVGNDIVINFTRFGGSRPVQGMITSVAGNEINYLYYSGESNTTLANVREVINSHPEASQLVAASGGDSTNLQVALMSLFGGLQDVFPAVLSGGSDGSGVNEVFQIDILTPSASNGALNFGISGSVYSIGVINGDSPASIVTNLNFAINTNPVPGYTNSVSGNSIILTSIAGGNVPDLNVILTETPYNTPPIIDYVAVGSPVYEGDVASIQIVAFDSDGDTLTYSVSDPNFIETLTPGVFEWQTEPGDSTAVLYGIYENIVVSASDGAATANQAVDIFVLNPAISFPIPPFFSQNEPISYDIEVGQTLIFKKVVGSLSPLLNVAITNLPTGAEQIFLGNGEIMFRWTPIIGDVGSYLLNFSAIDEFGSAETNVTVNVLTPPNNPPVINNVSFASPLTEGDLSTIIITASDADGDQLIYSVDNQNFNQNNPGVFTWQTGTNDAGIYNLNFSATDGSATTVQAVQLVVNVLIDTVPPVITLLGTDPMDVIQNTVFIDPGVTAMDDVDGDITANVVVTGTVDTATLGAYVLTYDVADSSGNAAVSVTRTVNVNALPVCQTGADTSGDGSISNLEILNYITAWKNGSVSNLLILNAIQLWKVGIGC